jgi:hypothetical protein
MAVGIFVVTLLLLLVVRGWIEMKRQWVRDIFIGVIAVAVGRIGLFLWSTAKTIYEDHQAFVTQSANLLKENAALKSQTSGCWLTTLGMKPPSFLPKASSSGNAIVFFCDTDYDAPLSVTWDFDRPVQSISVPLFPDARPSKATIVNQGQRAWSFVERPSLLKFQPRCERDKLLFAGVPSPNLCFRRSDRINGIHKYLPESVAVNRSKPCCHRCLSHFVNELAEDYVEFASQIGHRSQPRQLEIAECAIGATEQEVNRDRPDGFIRLSSAGWILAAAHTRTEDCKRAMMIFARPSER